MTVFLVGAGPGDPDLLTVRAATLLALADVVIVDRLVDPRVLDECRPDARVIEVGKSGHDPENSTAQSSINDLLILYGATEDTVVRLKGGDPFLFGRGAEEADALAAAGIPFEVVPGVSSAMAVPALAGIPVTDRRWASSVTVLSGHDPEHAEFDVAARSTATLVLLMAVRHRARIATRLMQGGRAASTPVAVIERGATPTERRRLTTLGELGSVDVVSPAVLVVGAVAARVRLDYPTSTNSRPSSLAVSVRRSVIA